MTTRQGSGADGSSVSTLSSREVEIIGWIAEGKTNAEISAVLSISRFTVKNHVQRIIKKLGVANRTEAAVWFLRRTVARETSPGTSQRAVAHPEPAETTA